MVVSSPTTGPVMTTTATDVALHGRHLNEVAASTVGEFTAAVGNSAVDKILLAAGTYELTSDMCTGSAVCISRALIIEAEVPGAVVLNAMGARRVFVIQSGGTAELIGLNITGGYASGVQSARLLNPCDTSVPRTPMCNVPSPRWNVTCSAFGLQGGGSPSGHGNTDQHQRVLESGIWGALTFCPCLDVSSIAPMEC